MPTKSLVKSMQAYARSLGNALEMIDDILTRTQGGGATAPPRAITHQACCPKITQLARCQKVTHPARRRLGMAFLARRQKGS